MNGLPQMWHVTADARTLAASRLYVPLRLGSFGRSGHSKVVSERLGHASVAFTLDVYTDSLPDMQETGASLIATLVLDP